MWTITHKYKDLHHTHPHPHTHTSLIQLKFLLSCIDFFFFIFYSGYDCSHAEKNGSVGAWVTVRTSHVGVGQRVCLHVCACVSWRVGVSPIFLFCLYSSCVHARVGTHLSWLLFRSACSIGGQTEVFDSQRHFTFPLLLYCLYWPWDPVSSLQSTPVLIKVPKQIDCDMYGLSKILLFSVL